MRLILSIFLFMISLSSMANSLIGQWMYCDVSDDGPDIQHHLIFNDKNVEFEANLFIERKKLAKPCEGKQLLLVGSYWHYEEENSQFISTAFSHFMILRDPSYVSVFNKQKLCGLSNWKVFEKNECLEDKYLGDELAPRGKKTQHDFILKENELHIIVDGKTRIYTKYKSP